MPKVKAASVYFDDKKVATAQNVTYKIKTGDGQEVTDGGVYNTDGQVLTEVNFDTLVPLAGVGVGVVKAAVNHQDVALTLGIIDGTIHQITDARAQECEFSGEFASGKLTGKFSFHGGPPKITG